MRQRNVHPDYAGKSVIAATRRLRFIVTKLLLQFKKEFWYSYKIPYKIPFFVSINAVVSVESPSHPISKPAYCVGSAAYTGTG